MSNSTALPSLPCALPNFIKYITDEYAIPVQERMQPFAAYDARVRELFAQQPNHPALSDPNINVVSIFDGSQTDIVIRPRDLDRETQAEKEKYIMPLSSDQRRKAGSPAVVESLQQFRDNFNVFSESTLSGLDWSNVVAVGSSVVSALVPVPKGYGASKRMLRKYYHNILAPASDVDLFLYGLSEEEALRKIDQIERHIRDAVLQETTTIRTKNCITIASRYPTRHVQIVLRLYKSVSEILTGLDIDCSSVAYDGNQVYASPRAIAAYMTQVNPVDLTRRSPSYETRLAKYAQRGFEAYWPELERSRIDPTIFERSFRGTQGLARLLVLEKLPTGTERDNYMDQRRKERGRPAIDRDTQKSRFLRGDIKTDHQEDVPDWAEGDEISNYNTFAQGAKEQSASSSGLFGSFKDVVEDCCGSCPEPSPDSPEEMEIAERESKRYVSGRISFIKDDPGRQAIGSFHPITTDDWTEMAYVGDEVLYQAIVDGNFDKVQAWLSGGGDPNMRDITGRTPLHLAVISSTPEIIQCLVDHGARLVARLADGRTALHLAAALGRPDVVRILLLRSEANEAEANEAASAESEEETSEEEIDKDQDENDDSASDEDYEISDTDEETQSHTTGSYVKVNKQTTQDAVLPDDEEASNKPDVYDVNLLAWDSPLSALHLAIANGHVDVVTELVQNFCADVLLPVKLWRPEYFSPEPQGSILTLVLALDLPLEKARAMASKLLKLGATSAQADLETKTALYHYVEKGADYLQILVDEDLPAARGVLNHVSVWNYNRTATPLTAAIEAGDLPAIERLLELGAKPSISLSDYVKSRAAVYTAGRNHYDTPNDAEESFNHDVDQPLYLAIKQEKPEIARVLLSHGADPNTLTRDGQKALLKNPLRHLVAATVLDQLRKQVRLLRKAQRNLDDPQSEAALHHDHRPADPFTLGADENYLSNFEEGSYQFWYAQRSIGAERKYFERQIAKYEAKINNESTKVTNRAEAEAVKKLLIDFEQLEQDLVQQGAKSFKELYPDVECTSATGESDNRSPRKPDPFNIEFYFGLPNVTPEAKQAYLEIFEAAWQGDLDRIKSYTLNPWGQELQHAPLQLAVTHDHSSPFSLAVVRGHLEVAQGILAIMQAQYSADDVQVRYGINDDGGDDDVESGAPGNGEVATIFGQVVDSTFTYNISKVTTQVRSDIKPHEFMTYSVDPDMVWSHNPPESSVISSYNKNRTPEMALLRTAYGFHRAGSLFDVAVVNDDPEILVWLLELYQKHARLTLGAMLQPTDLADVREGTFEYAIAFGRTRLVSELIRRLGAGIPLEELIEKSGEQPKPTYYQGLSVRGRKRTDWADAARGEYGDDEREQLPPLLVSALTGSIESVKFFLSDAPKRLYAEFAARNKDWQPVKALSATAATFDEAVAAFLTKNSSLALRCAVVSRPRPGKNTLVRYLASIFPDAINTIIPSRGCTLLHLAYAMHHPGLAEVLLEAGADPSIRDSNGGTVLHDLLRNLNGYHAMETNVGPTRALISLLPEPIRSSLWRTRANRGVGRLTPLHEWLVLPAGHRSRIGACDCLGPYDGEAALDIFRLLLDAGADATLDLVNGAGDTVLHSIVAARPHSTAFMTELVTRRPDLLRRENAAGKTPIEVVEDGDMAARTRMAGSIDPRCTPEGTWSSVFRSVPRSSKSKSVLDERWDAAWADALERSPGKRTLIGLAEAREVLRRLDARREAKQREAEAERAEDVDDESDDENERRRQDRDPLSEHYTLHNFSQELFGEA